MSDREAEGDSLAALLEVPVRRGVKVTMAVRERLFCDDRLVEPLISGEVDALGEANGEIESSAVRVTDDDIEADEEINADFDTNGEPDPVLVTILVMLGRSVANTERETWLVTVDVMQLETETVGDLETDVEIVDVTESEITAVFVFALPVFVATIVGEMEVDGVAVVD